MSSTRLDAPPNPVLPTVRRRGRVRGLISLVRPHQWVKNLLVLIPLVDPVTWPHLAPLPLTWAVLIFILTASIVYVGNDLLDRDRDRRHPAKRERPIASGEASVPLALIFGLVLLGVLVALLATAAPGLAFPVGCYLVLNVLYTIWLKHIPLLDLFVVVIGLQLRIVAGYQTTGVAPSIWLLLCALFLCLVLLLGKRRSELKVSGTLHRPALRGYSAELIGQMLTLSAGLAAMSLMLFLTGVTARQPVAGLAVLLLTPLALLGLFRYLQILAIDGGGADPSRTLVRDRVILVIACLCALIVIGLPLLAPMISEVWLR
ncbi:UbiA family prenyltransferase [Streptosporangium soli]|nr:UbiA family prenyltransferase [Streptosporangium sp. KLBMP 9127]